MCLAESATGCISADPYGCRAAESCVLTALKELYAFGIKCCVNDGSGWSVVNVIKKNIYIYVYKNVHTWITAVWLQSAAPQQWWLLHFDTAPVTHAEIWDAIQSIHNPSGN